MHPIYLGPHKVQVFIHTGEDRVNCRKVSGKDIVKFEYDFLKSIKEHMDIWKSSFEKYEANVRKGHC
jgi:hypothetical protein